MIGFSHTEIGFHIPLKDPSKSIYKCHQMLFKNPIANRGKELGIYQIKVKVKLRGKMPKKELMPF